MATVTKINVGKNEEATAVVEQLIDAEGEEVLVVIPKQSRVAESGVNFRLLKREADMLKKKVRIESVDDAVLALCAEHKIPCTNPFFEKPSRKVSDITPRKAKREEMRVVQEIKEEFKMEEEKGTEEMRETRSSPASRGRKWVKGGIAVLVLLAGSVFAVGTFLKKADIALTRATASWTYAQAVRVSPSFFAIDAEKKQVPGQIFSEKKNVVLTFPATGKRTGASKASGIITIYNAFNTQPQTLVTRTRFATPDGKIFRIEKTITVPGGTIAGGKLSPSSIDARVVADGAGAAYNIPPVPKFTIPGFAGTPRFAGFYAASSQPMTGGGSGETAYATAEDITAAKEMSAKTLTDTLRTLVGSRIPEDFTVAEGAQAVRIEKQTVDTATGNAGQFNVFTEGTASIVAFKEADLRAMIEAAMKAEKGSEFEIKEATLSLKNGAIKREGETLVLPVEYSGTIAKIIDLTSFKKQIVGASEKDLKRFIFSISGLASAKISLWPFWVKKVPDADRVRVTVE